MLPDASPKLPVKEPLALWLLAGAMPSSVAMDMPLYPLGLLYTGAMVPAGISKHWFQSVLTTTSATAPITDN